MHPRGGRGGVPRGQSLILTLNLTLAPFPRGQSLILSLGMMYVHMSLGMMYVHMSLGMMYVHMHLHIGVPGGKGWDNTWVRVRLRDRVRVRLRDRVRVRLRVCIYELCNIEGCRI